MKMTELLAENESLKQQLQLLSQQKEGGKDGAEITQLKDKNRALRKSVKDLKAETAILSGKVQTLENDNTSQEQEHQLLKAEFERIQQQYYDLSDVHIRTTAEVESLRTDQKALQEKTAQLPVIQAKLDRLQQVESICSEKTAQVVALQTELEQRSQLLEEVKTKISEEQAEHQDQKGKLISAMEMLGNKLQTELEAERQKSEAEIASLQTQKDNLSTKITELTDKLKLVATYLEKQLNEKRKLTTQHDTNIKEFQSYKDKSEKQINDLMALMQKMAAELDASRSAHPAEGAPLSIADPDKPSNLVNTSVVDKPPQLRLQDLEDRLVELDQINANQAKELAALTARMKRIHHALATPIGRLFSQLAGLQD
jgi:chromosome segregation ATPase